MAHRIGIVGASGYGGAELLRLVAGHPAIEAAVDVPLLHVADTAASACRAAGATTVGLLGTRFTMEEAGVRDRLAEHRLDVLVPVAETRTAVHAHIYDELVHGTVTDACRTTMRQAAAALVADGAQAIIAGCTEIELALLAPDVTVAYVPTTAALMDAAVAWLLHGEVPVHPNA